MTSCYRIQNKCEQVDWTDVCTDYVLIKGYNCIFSSDGGGAGQFFRLELVTRSEPIKSHPGSD